MMRRVFDDDAGKHVAKPSTGAAAEIFEPLPEVVAAMALVCPICNAKPGEKCGSIVDASKYFEVPHAGRVELARRSA